MKISVWFMENQIKVSAIKTMVMIFDAKNKKATLNSTINSEGRQIESVDNYKIHMETILLLV